MTCGGQLEFACLRFTGMIEAEIVPELALRCCTWELFLGMPIYQTIEILKRFEGIITNIDVWYSEKVEYFTIFTSLVAL